MEWPDDLAAELPEPNPDEPKSLREDILDELRDHLQSSLELEQLKGTPASEAERAVITKFGNPVQTARQLWWDAMKGRIMSQRITLGLVIVLCLLSVAATAMLWQTVQQGQKTTAVLIAELRKLADREVVPAEPQDERLQYLEWIPVKILVKDETGNPVSGEEWTVTVSGALYRDGENSTEIVHPNHEGVCDVGLVRLGKISVTVGNSNYWMDGRNFSIRPGKPFETELIVPSGAPEKVEQLLTVDWPEELNNESLWTHLVLRFNNFEISDRKWYYYAREVRRTYYTLDYVRAIANPGSSRQPNRDTDTLPAGISVLVSPEGKLFVGELEPENLYVESVSGYGGVGSTIYHELFSNEFERTYHPPQERFQKQQPELDKRLFPLVRLNDSNASDRFSNAVKLLPLVPQGVDLVSLSVIANSPLNTPDDFIGRVVLFASGSSLNSSGKIGTPVNIQFDEMFSFDSDRNLWRFVPSERLAKAVQRNVAVLEQALDQSVPERLTP